MAKGSLSVMLCLVGGFKEGEGSQPPYYPPYPPPQHQHNWTAGSPIPKPIVMLFYPGSSYTLTHLRCYEIAFLADIASATDWDQCIAPGCPYPGGWAADRKVRVMWSDNGAGGQFGTLDSNGNFIPLDPIVNAQQITHYRAPWDRPGIVHITLVVDDEGLYYNDNPPVSNDSDNGNVTVWEFEIDPPYVDALPQDGATYTFTATIRPDKDHNGNSMARIIEFYLYSSREPGYCMNATRVSNPRQWTDTGADDNDLKFLPNQPGLEISSIDPDNPLNYNMARTTAPVLTISVQVRCLDYGAYGFLQAVAWGLPPYGYQEQARKKGHLNEYGADIPRDENPQNDIYDGWIYESRPEGDQDNDPPFGVNTGDGVVKYEEYRGFIINGSHFRTDPGQKMLWLVPEEGDSEFRSSYGIGYARNLMTAVYQIDENGIHAINSLHPNWPIDRRINWMTSGGHGHTDQNAVRIIDGGYSEVAYGVTFPWQGTPNTVWMCVVFTESLREDFGQINDRLVDEIIDIIAIMRTIAHEVGHSVNINHYPWREEGGNTVMADFPDPPHPVFTDIDLIPVDYDNNDRAQMQLH